MAVIEGGAHAYNFRLRGRKGRGSKRGEDATWGLRRVRFIDLSKMLGREEHGRYLPSRRSVKESLSLLGTLTWLGRSWGHEVCIRET